jgi:adenylosuccinate synthase
MFKISDLQVKAYSTRVGAGPYPTEIFDELADSVRTAGYEFGTTTGRPRRCGWLDMVALKYSCQINGFSYLNMTKLDVLSVLPTLRIGVAYRAKDGRVLPSFPSDLHVLEEIEVRILSLTCLNLESCCNNTMTIGVNHRS